MINAMKVFLAILALQFPLPSFSQVQPNICTQDLQNFWIAYDSIRSTNDKEQQIDLMNRLYIQKGSEGLKAFLKNKENSDKKWVDLINSDTLFWNSIRPKTLQVVNYITNIQKSINDLKAIYPNLKQAGTYFIIGFKQQGGTIRNNLSIIGTEVMMSDPKANETELTRICIHEYVHTQQIKPDFQNINVLASSIREGACDFISELVLKQKLSLPYINYGKKNEVNTWAVFANDMLTSANNYWVSTGDNPVLPTRDLGYYVGYAICKSYYDNAEDKAQATKDIIDLDYANQNAVASYLKNSKYEKYIASKGYNSTKKLMQFGYTTKGSKVLFSFPINEKTIAQDEEGNYKTFDKEVINSIALVGDFNNWGSKDSSFMLKKDKKGKFYLLIDKSKLGANGTKVKFKFFINNKYWGVPNFEIRNRITDKEGNTNLFIQI